MFGVTGSVAQCGGSGETRGSWVRGTKIGLAAVVVALTASLGACGQGDTSRAISVVTKDGKAGFAPTTVTVDKGDKINLAVGNTTEKTHGFSIQGYGVKKEVAARSTVHVIFRADKPGTYRISCQLHPAHQLATLVVQ